MTSNFPIATSPSLTVLRARTVASSLPTPLTGLIGRETELAKVRSLLDADHGRLVTLTGPGGIGKTRLALEVATSLKHDYAHGVHFVSLSAVLDADLIPAAITQSMGIRTAGLMPVSDVVMSTLRDRHTLLVLDNLEHVVEIAAPWVAELLSKCPRLHVLATSRLALRIAGERLELVQPLTLPDPYGGMEVDRIARSEAVQLFTQRARAIRSDFELTDANARNVSEICRRLDGIPLALELAAARVHILGPSALLERLNQQPMRLAGGGRDLPERHQTMANAVAWSYNLLAEPERLLFRRLCIFVSGFSLHAAEAVGVHGNDGLAETVVFDHLAELVDHSLVRQAPDDVDATRFTMLEPIREFGLDQLAANDAIQLARDAHAAYFVQLARQSETALEEYGHVTRLELLEAEHDNIWAALAWLTQQERIEEAMDLAGSIWTLRKNRRYTNEARKQLEFLLVHPQGAARTIQRARALVLIAAYASEQGDHARSAEAHEEALGIFQEIGDDIGAVRVLRSMALAMTTGDLDQAIDTLQESLKLARAKGHQWGIAAALDQLAGLHMYRNETYAALECVQESLRMHRANGDEYGIANALAYKGMLTARTGDLNRAAGDLRECIAVSTEIDDSVHLSMALIGLADVTRRDGDLPKARAYVERGLAKSREAGWLHGTAFALGALGSLAVASGDFEQAVHLLQESVVAFQRLGLRYGLQHGATICFDGFACLSLAVGGSDRAARFLGMADGLHERIGVSRPDGAPHFMDSATIVSIRRSVETSSTRLAWEDGHAMIDDEMVSEALAFELPSMRKVVSSNAVLPGAAKDLSPRELQVLRLMADGLSNQEIADALFVSLRTVTGHAANILGKLGVATRTGVVAYAIRNGLA